MTELRDRLHRHVDVLAELIGERHSWKPAGIVAARAYIARELTEMGHEVQTHTYRVASREAANLEVHLAGRRPERPTLVVGAHYDSVAGTPGADDNASAVAVLLEIARTLVSRPTRRPVRLVFFDCEEPPHFALNEMGSHEHARQCRERRERLMGMVCLESVGYYVDHVDPRIPQPWYLRAIDRLIGARHIVIVSDLGSIPFGLRFLASFVTSGRFPFVPAAAPQQLGAISLSDHRSYWEMGYRALMVTDTAFMRNPNYHQRTDRLATLDLDRMTRLCQQLCGTIRRLAG